MLVRRRLPPPAPVQVYELTEWGYESEPIFQALGRWGARSPGHDPGLPLSAASLLLSLRTMLDPDRAAGLDARVGFRFGEEGYLVRLAERRDHLRAGRPGRGRPGRHRAALCRGRRRLRRPDVRRDGGRGRIAPRGRPGPRPAARGPVPAAAESRAAVPRAAGRHVGAQTGAMTPAPEVYRDAPGVVSMAGLPARHAPGRVVAVEGGIEARLGASSIAGSTDAYYDRRPRPAPPDHARRPPRRRRAAALPDHLHRAAARRRDHPRRPRHRRDPRGRAVALLDHLLLVPAARPPGVARRLAGAAGGARDAVRAAGLARGHRRHRGRAHLGQGAGIADPPQPRRQAEPVAVPARPGLAVPGRGRRAGLAGRGGAADAAPGPARHPARQAEERPLPAAPAGATARPGAGAARRLVRARPADRGRARRRPHRDRPGAPRPGAVRGPATAPAAPSRPAAQVRPADDARRGGSAAGAPERPDPLRQAGGGALPHLSGGRPLPQGAGGARRVGGTGAAGPPRRADRGTAAAMHRPGPARAQGHHQLRETVGGTPLYNVASACQGRPRLRPSRVAGCERRSRSAHDRPRSDGPSAG